MHSKEFSGNQRNFDSSILPYKFELIFMGMKQKQFFFEKKIKMADSKQLNSQNFFAKISGIGPWVSRIN